MNFLAISIAIAIILCIWRKHNHKFQEEKFRFKLYQLRDKLRLHAINGDLNINELSFKYLDSALSRTIANMYYITFPVMFFIHKHNEDTEFYKHYGPLLNIVNNNPLTKAIYDEFKFELKDYLSKQHVVTSYLIRISLIIPILAYVGFRDLKNWFNQRSEKFSTSMLDENHNFKYT